MKEGIALLAEYWITGHLNPAMEMGFRHPETSLVNSLDPCHGDSRTEAERLAQYGHLLQFFYYLHRLCGGAELFKELAFSVETGVFGVEFLRQALAQGFGQSRPGVHPVCRDFTTVFTAFQKARFAPDLSEPHTYVLGYRHRGAIRSERRDLPPYSAGAYRSPREGSERNSVKCREGDLELAGGAVCLQVRFE